MGYFPSTTLIHVELPFISCFHIEIKSTQLDYNLCKLVFGNLFESLQVLIGAQDAIITCGSKPNMYKECFVGCKDTA